VKLPPEVLEQFKRWGAAGGKKGGKIAAENMTDEQRSERARLGGLARHAKAAAKKAAAAKKKPR
jgi:hypothetical protein